MTLSITNDSTCIIPMVDNSKQQALDNFLAGVEQRAFRIARFATRNDEDALDLVQDAMLKLIRKYAAKVPSDWPPLFHRILQNGIRDWIRRQQKRPIWQIWSFHQDSPQEDPISLLPDPASSDPQKICADQHALTSIQQALENLPPRQQQAFLLRAWEGLDVKETAYAMGCSQGSVKTHYSRAIHRLRNLLGDDHHE